jgi:molybdopterin synthase catalytic subunit
MTWLALTPDLLSPGALYDWAVHPSCGAVVLFSGTVRDHAEGRSDVTGLTYEAYETQVVPRFEAVVAEARSKWPEILKVAVHHRTGSLDLGESSVVVVVSSPHRPEAFESARFLIDVLKASIPIWKKEHWSEGDAWGTNAHDLIQVKDFDHSGGPR